MTRTIKLVKNFRRPWGGYIKFIDNKPCTVKTLYIKKGELLSLQFHKLREEFWYVVSGKIRITLGKDSGLLKKRFLGEEEYIKIPRNFLHRIEGIENSKILEISTGEFKENDEIRIEDRYKRKSPKIEIA